MTFADAVESNVNYCEGCVKVFLLFIEIYSRNQHKEKWHTPEQEKTFQIKWVGGGHGFMLPTHSFFLSLNDFFFVNKVKYGDVFVISWYESGTVKKYELTRCK